MAEYKTYDARGNGNGEVCCTITGNHQSFISDYTAIVIEKEDSVMTYRKQGHPQNSEQGQGWEETTINDTLNAFDSGEMRTPTLICQKVFENHSQDTRYRDMGDICQPISATFGMGGNNQPFVVRQEGDEMNNVKTIVRRLTPLECERLQNYPDNWTNIGDWVDSKGKKHKGEADSPRYKALGNSIALCWWQWMANRMVQVLKEDGVENPTMGSLFDGISGFPLVFKKAGCEPIWTSEIEEFPIAVCKKHFGDEDAGIIGDLEEYL